jgi:PAS domain S-box-containing protein
MNHLYILSINCDNDILDKIRDSFSHHNTNIHFIAVTDEQNLKSNFRTSDFDLVILNDGGPIDTLIAYHFYLTYNFKKPFILISGRSTSANKELENFPVIIHPENISGISELIDNLLAISYNDMINDEIESEYESIVSNISRIFHEKTYELKKELGMDEESRQNHFDIKSLTDTILNELSDIVFIKEIETGRIIFVNDKISDFGVSSEHVIGKKESFFLDDEVIKTIELHEQNALRQGHKFFSYEIAIDLKITGKKHYFNVKSIHQENLNGDYAFVLKIVKDISRQKYAEDNLTEAQKRNSIIFKKSPLPITVSVADTGEIVEVNDIFLEYTGYSHDEIMGKNIYDLPILTDLNKRREMAQKLIETGQSQKGEIEVYTKNREKRNLILTLNLMEYADTKYVIAISEDITQSVKNEKKLKDALSQQKELNMLRSQFISMISHEFRTPLTTIMLSTDMLKRYSDNFSEDDKKKHYNRIQDTVLKMTQMMENVLVLGKIDSGNFEYFPDTIDLEAFCDSIIHNIEMNTAGKYKIRKKYQIESDNIYLDENLMALILRNLFTNAIKFSTSTSEIEFKAIVEKDIKFIIKDNGIGIPQKDLEHIYDSFYRGSNVGNIPGYGLGLSIVKKCVKLHNGTITVHSEIGSGTEIIVKLPNSKVGPV